MPCFHYLPAQDQATRDAVFVRMSAEGLLGCAMSAFAAPSLDDWQRITDPAHSVLLCCYPAAGGHDPAAMLACALFTPRRGKLWEFDFTTFRAAARLAVPMARDGLGLGFYPAGLRGGAGPLSRAQPPRLASGPSLRFSVVGPAAASLPSRPEKPLCGRACWSAAHRQTCATSTPRRLLWDSEEAAPTRPACPK